MREYGYLEKMLDILTDPYTHRDLQNVRKNRKLETNIGKLFSLLADGFEVIHKNAELVRLWDDLENAEGAVLDRYGANFGVQRGAASDALYRILIRVKMLAQLSGGDGDTVIRAAGELLGVQFSDIELQDVYPAKVALYVDQSLLSEERLALIDQIAVALKRIHDEHQQHELWRLGKQSDAKQGTGERKLSHQPDREHADGRTSL